MTIFLRYKKQVSDQYENKILSFSVVMLFFSLFLNAMLNNVDLSIKVISLLPKLMFFFSFVVALPSYLRKVKYSHILIILLIFLFFIFNMFFDNNRDVYIETFKNYFFVCFPVFIYGLSITEFNYMYCYFIVLSKISAILLFLFYITGFLNMNEKLYEMGLGYSLVVFLLFLLNDFMKKKSIVTIFSVLFITFFLFAYASRGIIICIFAYYIVFLYKNIVLNINRKKSILVILFLSMVFVLRKFFLSILYSVFERFNIYSRTLNSIVSGTITQTSGRNLIYSKIWEEIYKEPLAVRGINAEYNLVGIYAHNVILELLYQFGMVIGFLLVLLILYNIIYFLNARIEYNLNSILLCLLSVWLPYLLISSSLWVTPHFWLFMSLMTNLFFNRLKSKKVNL